MRLEDISISGNQYNESKNNFFECHAMFNTQMNCNSHDEQEKKKYELNKNMKITILSEINLIQLGTVL